MKVHCKGLIAYNAVLLFSLAATIIAAMHTGLPTSICARLGILAARKSLESFEAVPDTITPQLLVVTPQLYGKGTVN